MPALDPTTATAWLAAAVLLLGGCAFKGSGYPYAKTGLGSPARHNVEPMIGAGYQWDTGASCEIRYQPWFRVEDPSTRGFPQEIGRVYAEATIPLKGR